MSSNNSTIAEKIHKDVEALLEMVSGETAQNATADQMERRLWNTIMAIGNDLMQTFFDVRSAREVKYEALEEAGKQYPYMGQARRDYISIFGQVEVERAYYWQKGQNGKHPLDADLGLPERSYSDWTQEIMGELSVMCTQAEALSFMTRWLPLKVAKRSVQQVLPEHAEHMQAYYAQRAAPEVGENDTILVAQADGTGIRMTRKDSPPVEARRDPSQRTATKQAVTTALYTIAPYQRSSDSMICALMGTETPETPRAQRPRPTGKQIFGTLAGKSAALSHLASLANRRQDTQLVQRIALTDGDRALQRHMQQALPDFTLILDFLHVSEHIWEAAHVLWRDTDPHREAWLEDALRCVLEDQLDVLLTHLRTQCAYVSQAKREILLQVVNYLERNRPYMQYQRYLAQGWPIGSGVIEGTCRHLVKDRFDHTGMRWSLQGAQAMLELRSIYLNGDWDDFQRFRRHEVHCQRYGVPHPDVLPETLALAVAA